MIDIDIKQKLIPFVKMRLPKDKWRYIDYMLSEVYLIDYGDEKRISLRPTPTDVEEARNLSLQFHPVTGSFVGIDFWSIIKKKGKLL